MINAKPIAIPNKAATPIDPGNSVEIHSLTVQSQQLADAMNHWNVGYIGAGAGALAVAFAILSIQWVIIYKGRQLSATQTALLSAKDRQLQIALDQKDQDIAAVEGQAGDATERAANADERAANAELQAAEATKAAEVEKIARLELEAQIQPRQYTPNEEYAIEEACKPFRGKVVVIRSMPYDVEGAVFATSLAETLQRRTGLVLRTNGIGDNFTQNLPMLLDVYVVGPQSEKDLVSALARALATPRVLVAPLESPTPLGSLTTIIVGAKRLGQNPTQ
jgi:hypothetical protein